MNRSGIFPYVDLQGTDMALAKPSPSPRRQGTPSRSRTPSKRDILDRAAIDRLAREVRRTRPDSPTSPGGHGRSRTPEKRYEARAMQQRTRSVSRDGRLKASLRNSINSSSAVAKARPQSRPRQQEPSHPQPRRRSSQRRQEAPDVRRSWQDPARARPWDEGGYCPVHPDVRLAKKKRGGGWTVKLAECPKCLREKERDDTASVTSSEESEEEGRGRARSHSLRSKSSKGRSWSRGRGEPWGRKGSEGSRGLRRSQRSQHDAHDRSQSPKPARRRSFSLSSRSRKGGRGTRSKNRVPKCVNGAPFDKHGRCFDHPQVKLASKRLLGGWKIHMELCPLCERDGEYGGSDYGSQCGGSVASGMSQLSFDSRKSGTSARSGRSMRSANASVASRQSRGSVRSFASKSSRGSDRSTSSWSSGGSSGRRVHRTNSKDESFLPLDEEGYCLRHPDVQLAQMSRRGGLKIIMDFCPECAEESLARGGSGGSREIVAKRNNSTESVCSSHHSRRSSFRSDGSSSTYIERMPYVDGEGHPGHYTGHVDEEGQPDGEGKLRYINGDKYDGIWHGGTKLHGKTTKQTRSKGRKGKNRRGSWSAEMSPGPAPMPPPPFPGNRREGRQHSDKDARRSGEHRRSRRDAPGDAPGRRPHHDEGSSEGSSRGNRRGTVHRLRRKCDEIDALLKECPAAAHERKDSMDQID
ncbi:hypothetical protein ACHAXT_004554 [Thalassiosira profunda]